MNRIFFVCVLGGLLVGVGAVYLYSASRNMYDAAGEGNEPRRAVMEDVRREAPEGWKEYRNVQYRFSVLIPEALIPTVIPGEEASATIVFQDAEQKQGFQIFIVQYLEGEVSEERFRTDIPSGVRKDARDATIAGVRAAAFESFHENLGETAEVWFVRDGYLYEVTTVKELSSWMHDILGTWQFL